MAKSSQLQAATPKQLGKQLRAVRRRKGLSLSEVARGAGLSRRELVSYERGKVTIPESDLWVLAGSCGVDVAELVPPTETPALTAAPDTVAGTISQLRLSQDETGIGQYLETLYSLRSLPVGSPVQLQEREREAMADALGRDPATIEARLMQSMNISPGEAQRLRFLILPPVGGRHAPRELEAPNEVPAAIHVAAPEPPPPATNVDVFEELSRLPEPAPLPDANPVDVLAAPAAYEHAHSSAAAEGAGGQYAQWSSFRSALPDPPEPLVVEMANAVAPAMASTITGGADAPPVEVGRESESTPSWSGAGWGDPPPWDAASTDSGFDSPTEVESWDSTPQESDWPSPPPADSPWITTPEVGADATWAPSPFEVAPPVNGSGHPPAALEEFVDEFGAAPTDAAAWAHEPDPAATSSGFYVDWGTAEESNGHEPVPDTNVEAPWSASFLPEPDPAPHAAWAEPEWHEPEWHEPEWPEPSPSDVAGEVFEVAPAQPEPQADDTLAPISWRPLDAAPAAAPAPATETVADTALVTRPLSEPAPEPAPVPAAPVPAAPTPLPPPVERFVTAGPEWDLGNAVPLVEVRSQGGLVMRRADERWALADVSTATNFALEVDLDFRSGPGFGVLFHASTDDDGHMSGYSFDIDPIHEGGSYLVRQWLADRELWNPIAREAAADPTAMHGLLTLRIVVIDDCMRASVNGDEVLAVPSLKQACADRNREPALGDRAGIQAWSSSDLVIETLRVAER